MAELKCPHCGQAFTVDDTGSGVLLWGAGQKKKCGKYDDGMCGNHGIIRCDVGFVWLFSFVWR